MAGIDSFGWTFARTRVARRIVLLFVLCAIVPVATAATVSWLSVNNELRTRSGERLYGSSKSTGLLLMQRLQSLEWELIRLGRRTPAGERSSGAGVWRLPDESHFESFGFATASMPLPRSVPPDSVARAHMRRGRAVVYATPGPRGYPRVVLAALPDTADPAVVAFAEVSPAWLWGPPLTASAQPEPEFCVIRGREALFCPPRTAPRILGALASEPGDITFEWEAEDGPWMAATWPLFMRYYFLGDDWRIISSDPLSVVLAPLHDFTRAYVLILGASLVLVALVSLVTIRRNMAPLAELHAATRRIEARDFDVRVEVKSNDEFRALAESFNVMSKGLGRQFNAMDGMVRIGEQLLSARDSETIARGALTEVRKVVPCRAAATLLLPGFAGRTEAAGWVLVNGRIENAGPWDADTIAGLFRQPGTSTLPVLGSGPGPLPERLTAVGASTYLVYPFRDGEEVPGVIVFALDRELSTQDALFARQLSDNVAVALGGARAIAELNELSWGALRALARAIDAKSHWTAGHSDRVTALAMVLGRHLGVSSLELGQLERGGLLHDIGKIGVSSDVLDKKGPLDADEWVQMRAHTTLGATILEPIARYADIVPIVLYHHERWDGGGYPQHLAGEAIPLLARILSFADVYDALTSDRPYRSGMSHERTLGLIEAGLGTQFDPAIGRVFVDLMREGGAELGQPGPDAPGGDLVSLAPVA
ncbi:MAG: HD domain-containing protein [Gemmatimonadota bacterium]|jgi:putative nucleotidyltransferase with HDIG domain